MEKNSQRRWNTQHTAAFDDDRNDDIVIRYTRAYIYHATVGDYKI